MGIFGKGTEKSKLVLVFDIGSSSIGAALFWTRKEGAPTIIFSLREPIVLETAIDAHQLLTSAIQALNILVHKVHKANLGTPSEVFCVLSSSWYSSQTRIIKLEKNTSFIFTSKLADELIKKEISLFEEEHKIKDPASTLRVIELKNIKTMLNGYETHSPLDQKTKELEMAVFISMSSEEILNKIEDTIHMHFHPKSIKFLSFGMASFAVVRDKYIHNENFLLVDIGGEVTDVAMIKKNTLHESASFPLGHNFIIREVASRIHSSLDEASSYISLYVDGHADISVAKKLKVFLDEIKSQWLSKFQESLANLSHDISIPATIYLNVNSEFCDFFSHTIKTEQFNQYTLTESKFEIIPLNAETLHSMAEFKDTVPHDAVLIIHAVYINRFLL